MDHDLVSRLRAELECPTCGGPRVTTERLSREVDLSLRTVSRLLNGQRVSEETQRILWNWLEQRATA